jgi:hypothetical protein
MTIQLTPAERALLQGVAIPDLPVGALPSIKLLQTNSSELLNANDNEMFLEGAIAGVHLRRPLPKRCWQIRLARLPVGETGSGNPGARKGRRLADRGLR